MVNGAVFALSFAVLSASLAAAEVQWQHLSSARAELPLPSSAHEPVGLVAGDFNGDHTNDFVLSFSDAGPALVLYHGGGTNWSRLPIELEFLPIAPGGAAWDIDRDGDLDLVFGSETGPEVWWWENPAPTFDPNKSWKRHLITNSGGAGNRGQIVVDLLGNQHPGAAFWNQASNSVFFAPIPADPSLKAAWPLSLIFSPALQPAAERLDSLTAVDINIDGTTDLVAGHYWIQWAGGTEFHATRVGTLEGRSAVGRFRESTIPQIVVAPENSPGPVFWYECLSHPERPGSWAGRQLLGHDVQPIGTLAVGDIDKDGNDDILLGELATGSVGPAGPAPRAWIFYSDGKGNFRPQLFQDGIEMRSGKLVDLDKDGDLDLVSVGRSLGSVRLDIWLNVTKFKGPNVFPR